LLTAALGEHINCTTECQKLEIVSTQLFPIDLGYRMTPQDEIVVRQWVNDRTNHTHVAYDLILALTQDSVSEQMVMFCDRLQQWVPGIRIDKNPDEPFRKPAIIVGDRHNIAYQAVPGGTELAPFLDALAYSADSITSLGDDIEALLAAITIPANLTLYIGRHCPHCPATVRRILPLASVSDRIRLTLIDAEQFADLAGNDQIQSVPTLLLDGRFRWTGLPDLKEVLTLCRDRDPAKLSAASLRQTLEAGEAARLAQMMVDTRQIFPALIELLLHPRWSVRLGAMVTVEYLADEDAELAEDLVAPLWHRFNDLDTQIQGDVCHCFGVVGSFQAKDCLQRIAAGSFHEEVRQAAIEALEEI
jgi:hypothetical protein